jgi:hypothetical protein
MLTPITIRAFKLNKTSAAEAAAKYGQASAVPRLPRNLMIGCRACCQGEARET